MSHVTHGSEWVIWHMLLVATKRAQSSWGGAQYICHVTRVNASCHTCVRGMSTVAVNEPCHTYEWVMSHVAVNQSCASHMQMSQVTHMNESCHTYECDMSHIWMSGIVRVGDQVRLELLWRKTVNESCYTLLWLNRLTHKKGSSHTCEWVMSHIWMSYVTHVNESCQI